MSKYKKVIDEVSTGESAEIEDIIYIITDEAETSAWSACGIDELLNKYPNLKELNDIEIYTEDFERVVYSQLLEDFKNMKYEKRK